MRRVMLLYNPAAGRGGGENVSAVGKVAEALRARGIGVLQSPLQRPGSGAKQAADARKRGVDTIFACGGDGTVHDVLQGMVGQPTMALGVIPLGSANVLARHLRLSLDPVAAALQQVTYVPVSIAAGCVRYTDGTNTKQRHFLSLAGAGADGMLVYKMLASSKTRLGRWMYYARAARLFATSRFPVFRVACLLPSGETKELECVSAMAVRVGDLGGAFSPLVRGGDLLQTTLRVALVKAPARISLPAWFAMSWAGLGRRNLYAEMIDVTSFRVESTYAVQVQADGEWLGRTPCEVSLVPNAVRLLMPPATVA